MEQQHVIQFRRTRKFLLVLPLLVWPFLSLAFYALGGGKVGASVNTSTRQQGLNTSLPGARFDPHANPGDKMSFYDQARQDSDRVRSNANNAVLQQFGFRPDSSGHQDLASHKTSLNPFPTDPDVGRINRKLAVIKKEINNPQALTSPVATPKKGVQDDPVFNAQVDKLETMMKAITAKQDTDPQLQQLGKLLAQVQVIQHPELANTLLKVDTLKRDSAFRAIPAVIDGKQKIVQGSTVRLRLTDTLRVKGLWIPKGQLVFGTANITNQRLLLDIKNIRLGRDIIPVDLTVFSMDGMPGIPAPEAELAGAAGSGAGNAVESMQFLSMDQSLATQAAAGGIQAAKGLFSKKVRRVKVKLQDGYPLLLRDNHHK